MTDESKKTHFLVVDDDEDSRAMVVEYLQTLGYDKVTEAENGSEATKILARDKSIGFIISDWDMPVMNGHVLLNRVKTDPHSSHIPFMIITSPISDEPSKVVLAAEKRVDGYLIKPFRVQLLKEKIDAMLSNPFRGPQKKVLLVDDDEDSREMVLEYLKKMGFKDLTTFKNGREALVYLEQTHTPIGLIVSDWEMPETTGIELLKACRLIPALEAVPFLMITSQTSIERLKVMEAAKAHVDQYLLKPFSYDEMRERIENAIGKSRVRNEAISKTKEGFARLERGQYPAAEECFKNALEQDGNYDAALLGMGDVLQRTKGVEWAMPYFKKSIDANPSNPDAYIKLAIAYDQSGLTEKGIALLQSANKLIQANAGLHFYLGRLYNKKGAANEAIREFQNTLEIQLDHQEARLMLDMLVGRK